MGFCLQGLPTVLHVFWPWCVESQPQATVLYVVATSSSNTSHKFIR
jgi:hypothetical protein